MNTIDGSGAEQGSTIVVADALAARQWEMVLSAAQLGTGQRAWVTPPLVTYGEWLEHLWQRQLNGGTSLTPGQSRALWRRVVTESEESTRLIAHDGVAGWAEEAWQLMQRWGIDPERQRARADEQDYRALLRWCSRYHRMLERLGFLDRPVLERQLSATAEVAADVVLLDLADEYPTRAALLERLAGLGSRLERRAAPAVTSRVYSVRLADSADEVQTALRWAHRHLAATPHARVAVVVAGLRRRYDDVQGFIDAEFPAGQEHAVWLGGAPLLANAAVGAAVAALRLLTPTATYADFGRWLRSPFFVASAAERGERALLDASLRADISSQLPFAAYREGGLSQRVQRQAPGTAALLAAALSSTTADRPATPGRWARECSLVLERLGWHAPRDDDAGRAWQAALEGLAQLTPVVGEITLATALAELAILLERPRFAPLPLRGLHVLGNVDEIGPGYEAAWLTGFTDAQWPEPARGNPLLPPTLQRAHAMPGATPAATAARAAQRLARVASRVPTLVASWPARVLDYEAEPSPAIRDWPELATALPTAGPQAVRVLRRETVADVPPPVPATALPGGAGMLGRQARCPLRAFCEDRLRARPLEPIGFGLPRHLRGTAAHRAAERLLADLPAQADLDSRAPNVAAVSEQVLREVFGRNRPLLQALYDLEVAQLRAMLTALLQAELLRQPFRVLAVEQKSTVVLGAWTIDVRVDRLDRLADGRVAVIDYKTGQGATSAGWFKTRLRDAQVPLYAVSSAADVGAAVIARLRPEHASYSGLWQDAAFPGRPNAAWDGDWPAQATRWRAELERLAAEFAAGDTRVFVDASDEAGGPYAALTRVHEQLALRRGAALRW